MQQRLVRRRRPSRSYDRRHRLDALALAWHQQSSAVVLQRRHTVRMPKHTRQAFHISGEPRFVLAALLRRPLHPATSAEKRIGRISKPSIQRILKIGL
jgi:hypothetical protein